jgi:acyl-CoA synthetase (AMP-forming)/AMP-acid ligase II
VTLIPDQLRWAAEHLPGEVGFTAAGIGSLTLGEWHGRSSQVARSLVARGVEPGDRVALVLQPQDALTFVIAYAAAHKAGGVAVPVNTRLSAAQLRGILEHCEPRVVVVSRALRDIIPPTLPGDPQVVVADTGDADSTWDELLDAADDDLQVPRDPDDLAEILYTSGTTSTPKGVAIRHSNSALYLKAKPEWSGRTWLHASPMFTFAGLTFVYQPMRMGISTLYLPKFTTADWLRLLDEAKPKACFLVPSMVELLLADPATPDAAWSAIEMLSVGSAPIAPSTLLRLAELVPDALVTNSYSMTEAGTAYFMMPKGALASHPGSVGQPVPPAEVRILDDDGKSVGNDEIGHIHVKPAGKMREYYKAPEASADVFHSDGWLRTGDLGRFDADGFLYIVGRAKDVIIRGGMNVYAADVEATLYEHPAVREAAVVGVEHAVLGEDVVGFVVLTDPGSAGADELIEFCRERLADYASPRRVHVVDELPRNATGKVVKRDLREPEDAI